MYTHDEFHVHKFTAAAPDKVEMKDQNMQTENAEFKHKEHHTRHVTPVYSTIHHFPAQALNTQKKKPVSKTNRKA